MWKRKQIVVVTKNSEEIVPLCESYSRFVAYGGVLKGQVEIELGKGFAGYLGRRLSKKLGLPVPGVHDLEVKISHSQDGLHWDRTFNDSIKMTSTFEPVKTITDGHWLERTGPLEMLLTVDIKNRGWYWRCIGFKVFGVPIPAWFFPDSQAYKYIDDGGYNFYVGFKAPIIGLLLSYGGILQKK